MIQALRQQFNRNFTKEKYDAYVKQIEDLHPGALDFRNAETPIFVPKGFTDKMLKACDDIVDVIINPKFMELTERGIPKDVYVPGQNNHSHFIAFDFGVCENGSGQLEPQLIEMQGFPTLFAFQAFHSEFTAAYANMPANFSPYLSGYNKETYLQLLKEIIVGDANPENVILLEIFPEQQKTELIFTAPKKPWA